MYKRQELPIDPINAYNHMAIYLRWCMEHDLSLIHILYSKKYWGNFVGGSDDSLNLVAFLVDQKKEEIHLSEIFAKIGLDKQNCCLLYTSPHERK